MGLLAGSKLEDVPPRNYRALCLSPHLVSQDLSLLFLTTTLSLSVIPGEKKILFITLESQHRLMTLPYQGVSRIEFHVCCLWIPVVRQGVDCFYSVGLGCSWTFTVIIFNDQCDSTLFVSMYISFA